MAERQGTIGVENINHPGTVREVDARQYAIVKRSLLKVIPRRSPGLTLDEIRGRLAAHLPDKSFPGSAKLGWWMKTVQLDLEAKGVVIRSSTRPIRLRQARTAVPGRRR